MLEEVGLIQAWLIIFVDPRLISSYFRQSYIYKIDRETSRLSIQHWERILSDPSYENIYSETTRLN